MPLTDEARGDLLAYVDRLLAELDPTGDLWPDVLDSKHRKKGRQVVKIRDRLIWRLWTRCWQGCGGFLVDQDDPGGDWQHLSHPNIAAVLGLDPSAVTLSLKRTREKRQFSKTMKMRIGLATGAYKR